VPLSGELGAMDSYVVRAAALARLRPHNLRHLRTAGRRELPGAALGRPVQIAREAKMRAVLRYAEPLAGVILCGTTTRLPPGKPYVTLEDTTIGQAHRSYPWPWLRNTTEADQRLHDRRSAEIYAGARGCCMYSHWAAESVIEDYAVNASRVHVVGAGPIHRTSPPGSRNWNVPHFLFVGFDWERKNGPRVLRAFADIRYEQPEATLDVVGNHPALDVPGVTGHGPIALDDPKGKEKLTALYARATCFVMPSIHEPLGQAYIEAGRAGIPSIGTINGGSQTAIGDGGRVVDPLDDAAIVTAMRELGSGLEAERAGERARRHVAQLTWSLVAERLVRALAPEAVDRTGLASFL
jgi:glycosyltransferase involved in cell wall biosynthesis